MAIALFAAYLMFTLVVLYRGFTARIWEIGSAVYLFLALVTGTHWLVTLVLWIMIMGIIALVEIDSLRRAVSDYVFIRASKTIPKLSKTEEEALNAGDTWLEESLFRGEPDWQRLATVQTHLTAEEQAFIDNETHTLCGMLDDWAIGEAQDLPPAVWQFIKDKGFLGLVIAKEYGGKGFSARAHSDIVIKLASRSSVAAVTVMVPNSLGPGELLQHYGTAEQKTHYLPRLAQGLEIPCFALTEPDAGSDATSIRSEAVVIEHTFEGKKQLALRLNLNKRWITLAPVATLIGLAVNLKDPQGLLQGHGQEGITCVLIPRDIPNLEIGNRHIPANQHFMNGTIRGENIIVPLSYIIGGQHKAGHGWQMLVECLSIGRSISLPALGAASSSISYLTAGAFARIRRQFNVEIGQFEGIQEKLAEIAGLNYLICATRLLTLAAVNEHKKPSVASAITKYFNTELARITINNAMDIHAGRAVVTGPRNYLFNYYQSIPISVTVEGANIMSRNLLIFGQGSMACHPFVRQEFYAIAEGDKANFHHLLWGHIRYFLQNFAKALVSGWTGGALIGMPTVRLKREAQRLTALSHAYAWLADLALIYLGGSLKRKERLSARLADGMAYLYLGLAALRHAENDDSPEHQLHARWAINYCLYQVRHALCRFCDNFPARGLGWMARGLLLPFASWYRYPSDKLDYQLAQVMMQNNPHRDSLRNLVYLSGDAQQPVDRMEHTLQLIIQHEHLYAKLPELKRVKFVDLPEFLAEKVTRKQLSEAEAQIVLNLEQARWDAIQVDEFPASITKSKPKSKNVTSVD